MEKLFIEKYAPKILKDIKGQDAAVRALSGFIKSNSKRSAILYGPTGSGKTSSVYALANELGLELVEVNASDFRNAEGMQSIIGSASKQMSLFSKGKIILVDEVDGLSGTADRGGIPELIRIIDESPFPVICTAVDVFESKFSALRKKSLMIEFSKIDVESIYNLLNDICDKEKISFVEPDIKQLARESGGDIRAAITDLQTISVHKKILKEDILALSQRNKQESIPQALVKVFKSTDLKVALSAFENVDDDLNELRLWIDENLPYEYKNAADLARAYHLLTEQKISRSLP